MVVPSIVAPHFAASRIVVFSSGNVYPLVPAGSAGSTETDGVDPVGEYAQTCVGRERVFEHASRERGARCLLFRLFYAVDLRYGTLVDVARHVLSGEPVDLRASHVNAIWQGDANSYAFRGLSLCESPPLPLVVTGPESVSVQTVAEFFGQRFGRPVRFTGDPRPRSPGRPGEVRLAPRAARGEPPAPPRLGGRVGAAGRAQPRQAHPLRGHRWTLLASCARALLEGLVIPAHPLALTAERRLDERRQVALTRYYCDAGAGGVAVGVHTTQFAIRSAGLLEPVLRLAAGVVREREAARGRRLVKVAGVVGPTAQAVAEAGLARDLGYDLGLLSLGALREATTDELLAHCRQVAEVLPLFGFYLQPAVGGRVLDEGFWRRFLEIGPVAAIKVAPFNRYHTLDVARALAASGRSRGGRPLHRQRRLDRGGPALPLRARRLRPVRFAGGLLGQWAVWTRRAVELLQEVKECRRTGQGAFDLLALGQQLTDANAALFDARHGFAGCIAGIHEVLRRQGLLAGRWCLDPREDLSPGQAEEIDRVLRAYPHLSDDEFVAENLARWLS